MPLAEKAPLEKILVVGGGVSGLACACALRRRGLPVLLLESGERFGGVVDTVERDAFVFDVGPQSFLATAPISAWIAELGLASKLLRADPRAPRYILQRGRLVPAPLGPGAFLATPLVSLRTKLRLLTEPFHRTRPPAGDESIAAFVRRKFGADLLDNLVAPFVSGVYAGDPEQLSLPSAFPSVRRFEEQSGSVIRGNIKAMRSRPASKKPEGRAPLCNFRGGLRTLVDAAAAHLGDSALRDAQVTSIRRAGGESSAAPGAVSHFEIAYTAGAAAHTLAASAIIVATPTSAAADLLAAIEPQFAPALARIAYAPVVQIGAGYRLSHIAPGSPAAAARGFGFLVPRSEGLRLLGTVWNSCLFPGRAPETPERMIAFTSFLGGATDPAVCDFPDDEVAALACAELARVLHITGPPVALHVARWPRAIPQYNLGHARIVADLADLCARTLGVFLTGNYFGGPSLGACVEHANQVADAVASYLGPSAGGAA